MKSFLRAFVLSLGVSAGLASVIGVAQAQTFSGVLTWRNDNGRTGQNLSETQLTPANVKVAKFGKVFSFPVDGNIFAQPLYVPNVGIPNQGTHNVLYVATENDSVYAFDADGLSVVPLWQVSFVDPANGIVPQPCTTANIGCVITPNVGITGTPVIDPASQTLYVAVTTQEGSNVFQRLHALDITTGAEKFGGPVVIHPTFPGTGAGSKNGVVSFGPAHSLQRPGLLLANGTVYVSWTGTHGWIVGYNAQTLAQVAVFNTSPNSHASGLWSSGAGPAADAQGNVYVATGDGVFNADVGGVDYGDTVLKFNATLQVVDSFTPMDQACRGSHDMDVGAGGPMLVSGQAGPFPDEVFVSGKGGFPCDLFGSTYADPLYVLNQHSMGGYNPTLDQNVQTVAGPTTFVYGAPAYWQSATTSYIYLSGFPRGLGGDFIRAFSLTNGLLSTSPVSLTKDRYPQGSTPAISANGTKNGILWSIKRLDSLDTNPGPSPALLLAYDATNLGNLLYSSAQGGTRDQAGPATKFLPPTIANGRVYVGTQTEVDVYGLLPVAVSPTSVTFATRAVGVTSPAKPVTLTNVQSKPLQIINIATSGDFAQTNTCGTSVAAGANCTINVTFTPTGAGARTGTLTITDDASLNTQTVALSGIGTFIRLSGTTLPFGTVPVGQSLTKKISAKNTDTVVKNFTGITITGPNAADYTQTNTCGTSLAPGATCSISVTFTPSATGSRTATLSLVDDDPGSPQTVALSGTGS